MPELTKQNIIDKLNQYFTQYPYIFWFDPKDQFSETIKEIEPQLNGKVYTAHKNHQLETKLALRNDKNNHYLVHAIYDRPKINLDLLADMERYSKIFNADATQLIVEELGLTNEQLPFVKKYRSYFAAKARRKDFKRYWDRDFISKPEYGILAAITKTEKLEINELLMKVLSAGLEDNQYLDEFNKYNVQAAFWQLIADNFGYTQANPSLLELLCSIVVTYCPDDHLPQQYYLSNRINVQIFIDRYADSNRYANDFKYYTEFVWNKLDLKDAFAKSSLDDLSKLPLFDDVNELVLARLRDKFSQNRVTDYDTVMTTIRLMTDHTRHNYNATQEPEYLFLEQAALLFNMQLDTKDDWQEELQDYIRQDYQIDQIYRLCLLDYNRIQNTDPYSEIKTQVDYYYSTQLDSSIKQWNNSFDLQKVNPKFRQEHFYFNHVQNSNERIVVIFSDSLRYEVGKQLQDELDQNDRLSLNMNYALTSLPSITSFGMNLALPHSHKGMSYEKGKIKVDGQSVATIKDRENILQSYDINSRALQLKDILDMTSKEIRQVIAGQDIIYLYHNQIDVKGHETKTTSELIDGVEKAIKEITSAIQVLRTNNVSHIIVTTDHGFLYQERPLEDTDRINLSDQKYDGNAHTRYLITKNQLTNIKGIKETTMGVSLANDDPTHIYYPSSKSVFVSRGSSNSNYAHGGSSLQEMLIPILDIKARSNKSQAVPAEIKLAMANYKINNYQMHLTFNQVKAISNLVRPARYRVYFTDNKDNLISNQVVIDADRKGSAIDRVISVTITVQKQTYDYNRDYYLVIENIDDMSKTIYTYSMDLLQPK